MLPGWKTLDDSFSMQIIEKYRSFLYEEMSLKTKYDNLSQENEEKRIQCQFLRAELRKIRENHEKMPVLTSNLRSQYENLLSQEYSKRIYGQIADLKDKLALEMYAKVKDLVRRIVTLMEVIDAKSGHSEGELVRIVGVLRTLGGMFWGFMGEKSIVQKKITQNLQEIQEILGEEMRFVPGQPVNKEIILKKLAKTGKISESELELVIDEYKSKEILNYFTQISPESSQKVTFSLLIENAHLIFQHFFGIIFTTNFRFFALIQSKSAQIESEIGPKTSIFPSVSSPNSPLFPQISSNFPSDSSDSKEDFQENEAEFQYLEKSRMTAKTVLPKSTRKRRIPIKIDKLKRFSSHGKVEKSDLMHDFWSEMKQSKRKIDTLKVQETFFLTGVNTPKLESKRRILTGVKSVPWSPKSRIRPFSLTFA